MRGHVFAPIVGRTEELEKIRACWSARRNVLIEGPVGVGKTFLALAVSRRVGVPVFRVDGDNRYSEQKLSGWFDPPSVMKKGFSFDTFISGPLVEAMTQGGILLINELNRLPEGVQNILLPAIDERMVVLPKLGEIHAADHFLVIATQNPKEFVATSHLSEAILDRFELVILDYPAEEQEIEIVSERLKSYSHQLKETQELTRASVQLVRMTRSHPKIRRGASLRAALSISEITSVLIQNGRELKEAFLEAALMALPTRIEIEREADSDFSQRIQLESLVRELVESVIHSTASPETLKKKS